MSPVAVTYMGQKTLFLRFGCARPCEYYEFKVNRSFNLDGREIMK